jgi:hypothetical protein
MVDPRAGQDEVEKRKFLTLRDLNSDLPVVQPVASRCTDYVIRAPYIGYFNIIAKTVCYFVWCVLFVCFILL